MNRRKIIRRKVHLMLIGQMTVDLMTRKMTEQKRTAVNKLMRLECKIFFAVFSQLNFKCESPGKFSFFACTVARILMQLHKLLLCNSSCNKL